MGQPHMKTFILESLWLFVGFLDVFEALRDYD